MHLYSNIKAQQRQDIRRNVFPSVFDDIGAAGRYNRFHSLAEGFACFDHRIPRFNDAGPEGFDVGMGCSLDLLLQNAPNAIVQRVKVRRLGRPHLLAPEMRLSPELF